MCDWIHQRQLKLNLKNDCSKWFASDFPGAAEILWRFLRGSCGDCMCDWTFCVAPFQATHLWLSATDPPELGFYKVSNQPSNNFQKTQINRNGKVHGGTSFNDFPNIQETTNALGDIPTIQGVYVCENTLIQIQSYTYQDVEGACRCW